MEPFYYSDKKKIHLAVVQGSFAIGDIEADSSGIENICGTLRSRGFDTETVVIKGEAAVKVKAQGRISIQDLRGIVSVEHARYITPIFQHGRAELILKDEISMHPSQSESALADWKKLIEQESLTLKRSGSFASLYLVPNPDGFRVLEVANRLYESRMFESCHPNFLRSIARQ